MSSAIAFLTEIEIEQLYVRTFLNRPKSLSKITR